MDTGSCTGRSTGECHFGMTLEWSPDRQSFLYRRNSIPFRTLRTQQHVSQDENLCWYPFEELYAFLCSSYNSGELFTSKKFTRNNGAVQLEIMDLHQLFVFLKSQFESGLYFCCQDGNGNISGMVTSIYPCLSIHCNFSCQNWELF